MNRHTCSTKSLGRLLSLATARGTQKLKYQIEQLEQRVLLAVDSTAVALYETSPAVFVENKGQWADSSVKFLHQGKGASIALTDAGPVFQLSRPATPAKSPSLTERDLLADSPKMISTQFSVRFDGSNQVSPVGMDRSESAFNYFIGNQSTWRSNVGGFEKIEYPNLYNGIDLQTWGKKTHLKYEFHVAPGADYRQVQVSYEGINGLSIDRKGQLHVKTNLDELIDDKPFVYQDIDGKRVEVASKFVLVDSDTYRFQIIGKVDPSCDLVIDPSLAWGSYFGGTGSEDYVYSDGDVALDGAGNAWITGYTSSVDLPGGGFDPGLSGIEDAFVAKINANGTLAWSSYVGGSGRDAGEGIAIDGSGNAWLTGWTASTDFPGGGFDNTFNGDWDSFVVKINANGTLAWGSYLGGSGSEYGHGIAIDSSGNAWVTGDTVSTNFPGGGFDPTANGSWDAFAAKINANGTLAWGSYLGGSANEFGRGIAIDGMGNAWVTGDTASTNFPGGGFDSSFDGGGYDAFVAKINVNSTFAWGSYLGGSGLENFAAKAGIAIDGSNNAWVTGRTDSGDFPGGGFDSTYNGGSDAYVAKVNSNGTLAWGSYLGGAGGENGCDIAIDASGNAWITGETTSADFPGASGSMRGGSSDGFITELNANGTLVWGSYLGGSGYDKGTGIAVDASGNAWVTGGTDSTNFPGGGFDSSYNGGQDVFVAKIVPESVTANPGGSYLVNEGNSLQLNASGTVNPGSQPLTYAWDLNGDSVFTDATGVMPTLTWSQLAALGINDGPATWNNVRVRVTDDLGGTSTSSSTTLNVQDTPPTLTISGVSTVAVGANYTLNLSATDPGNDTVTGWHITWAPGVVETVLGNPSSATHAYTAAGSHVISATATNEDGTFTSSSLSLDVEKSIDWASYFGGSGSDLGNDIATDAAGNVWMVGTTDSTNLPGGGFDSSYNGRGDAFIAKVNANGTLAWASYLGGLDGDGGCSIALDGSGNAWVTGATQSTDFSVGGFDSSFNGGDKDAFVAKVNANGTLAWCSYLGGSGQESGLGIAIDNSGNAWVTGSTDSINFPGGGFDSSYNGDFMDGFVAKVNADGTFAWGSYLGGSANEDGYGIAVDDSGNAWITGQTSSTNFPGGGFDSSFNGGAFDAFVVKVNANGTLAWGSYLGGSDGDVGFDVTVDGSGNAWITGWTYSSNFPGGGFDSSFNGGLSDAFVAEVNANGTLAWASYLGGSGEDIGYGIAVDGSDNAWVTGYTCSTDFPGGGFDSSHNGGIRDAYVAKINSNGTLAWGSYLGGSGPDEGFDITADSSGNTWILGYTSSTDFRGGGFDSTYNGGSYDAFVAKVIVAANVGFSAASYSVNEASGTISITVNRTGNLDGSVTVDYATIAGGTATAGTDYLVTSGTLSFADQVTSQSFNITINNDTDTEPNETILLQLSDPTAGALLGQATATVTIIDNDAPPSAPSNLQSTSVTSNGAALAWADNSSTEQSFRIERKLGAGSYAEIGFVATGVTSFPDITADPGMNYSYRVRAFDGIRYSNYSNEISITTLATVPTSVSASDSTFPNKIRIVWNASVGAASYQVFRSTTNNSGATSLLGSTTQTTYDDTTATAGVTYYYFVKAVNTALVASDFSLGDAGRRAVDVQPPLMLASSYYVDTLPTQVRFRFSEDVQASVDVTDVQVFRLSDFASIPVMGTTYDPATNIAGWSLPVSLQTDNYRAYLSGTGIADSSGNLLFGTPVIDFWSLPCDAFRDRKIDTRDFNPLAGNFGGSGKVFSQGDFNYDSVVDSQDFNLFMSCYGTKLDPPSAGPLPMAAAGSAFSSQTLAAGDSVLGSDDKDWLAV